MRSLSVADIYLLHQKIIDNTGGSIGVRESSLIESALHCAQATFDGQDLYPSMESKIATITFGLIKNHGFVDGNKRVGVTVMLLILKLNGYVLRYTQNELVGLGLGVADGTLSEKDIECWIIEHKGL